MKYTPQMATCQHVHVAQSQVGGVAICPDCGVVHISLQYLSMRFDLEAFQALAQMLASAQNRIQGLNGISRSAGNTMGASNLDESPKGGIH